MTPLSPFSVPSCTVIQPSPASFSSLLSPLSTLLSAPFPSRLVSSTFLSTSANVMTTVGALDDIQRGNVLYSAHYKNHEPSLPFHGLPVELVQRIASFLAFEDLIRLYMVLPDQYRPIIQSMVDHVIALMVLQLEINQERSPADDLISTGSGIGGLANRVINRLLSLVVMEPSNLLLFSNNVEDQDQPLVPMANPDPHLPPPPAAQAPFGHGVRPRTTPVPNHATLSTSWRAVEFNKKTLRVTFELEEKLELERTVRQQQPFMFSSKDDESDDVNQHGSANASTSGERSQHQTIDRDKGVKGKKVGKEQSGLESRNVNRRTASDPHDYVAFGSPPATTTAVTTGEAIIPSPFQGLCQSLLDSHLRDNSYFHCISTTQPAFLQSAKVLFRGSRSMAAPWISLPSSDPTSLWSRPRAHWSLSDVEAALAQQHHLEEHLRAGRLCDCSHVGLVSPPTTTPSHRLSRRAQERVATFHQNRVLARFLANAHSLAAHRHGRDISPRYLTKEYLLTKVPIEVSEMCMAKTVQASVVSVARGVMPSHAHLKEQGVMVVGNGHYGPSTPEKLNPTTGLINTGRFDTGSMDQRPPPRRQWRLKRDVLRAGWQQLFGDPSTLVSEGSSGSGSSGSGEPSAAPVSGAPFLPELELADTTMAPPVPQLVIRTIRHSVINDHAGTQLPKEVVSPMDASVHVEATVDPGRRSLMSSSSSSSSSRSKGFLSSSSSLVSGLTRRLFESAHHLSTVTTWSSAFPQAILANVIQGPASVLVEQPFAFNDDDDDESDDEGEDENAEMWVQGNARQQHQKGKEWLHEKGSEVDQERIEHDQQQQRPGEDEQPLFELVYGVGHNYLNAARLEGERVIRPIRFSCSLEFFLSEKQ